MDQAVSTQVLRLLQPLGVTAALNALAAHDSEADDRRQTGRAQRSSKPATRQVERSDMYDAVEPENRNIAAELERRWNERLIAVQQLEAKLDQLAAERRPSIDERQRSRQLALEADLEQAWNNPAAGVETRKRILRTVLVEIVASVTGNQIALVLHRHGGDHTELTVIKARTGEHRWMLDAETRSSSRQPWWARMLPRGWKQRSPERLGRTAGFGPLRTSHHTKGIGAPIVELLATLQANHGWFLRFRRRVLSCHDCLAMGPGLGNMDHLALWYTVRRRCGAGGQERHVPTPGTAATPTGIALAATSPSVVGGATVSASPSTI